MNQRDILDQIDALFSALGASASLLPDEVKAGKMYEAWTLANVLEQLSAREGLRFRLVNGTKPVLKASPGPINPSYPHFEGFRPGLHVCVWTDIEFRTLSYALRGINTDPAVGEKHELDIVVVPAATTGYPAHDELLWGIECKNTAFQKSMARAALGVRRELSLLRDPQPTAFRVWPVTHVPAHPPSVLSVFSTSPYVASYTAAGQVYGVSFDHLPLP